MASRVQASKRGRKARKQAAFLGIRKNTGHPSHIPGSEWQRFYQTKTEKKDKY
jgi:hypothetical protein